MHRRDFELIAGILRECCEDGSLCFDDPRDQKEIARFFASCLAPTNPRFDMSRFIKASLPEERPA